MRVVLDASASEATSVDSVFASTRRLGGTTVQAARGAKIQVRGYSDGWGAPTGDLSYKITQELKQAQATLIPSNTPYARLNTPLSPSATRLLLYITLLTTNLSPDTSPFPSRPSRTGNKLKNKKQG